MEGKTKVDDRRLPGLTMSDNAQILYIHKVREEWEQLTTPRVRKICQALKMQYYLSSWNIIKPKLFFKKLHSTVVLMSNFHQLYNSYFSLENVQLNCVLFFCKGQTPLGTCTILTQVTYFVYGTFALRSICFLRVEKRCVSNKGNEKPAAIKWPSSVNIHSWGR